MLDKLRPAQIESVMAISKSVSWLREHLETRRERLLLMDCRARELYDSSHVEAAINVAIPSLMLRRLKKGNLPIKSLLSDGQDRERFARRCRTDTIVLYDECSRDWNENVDGGSVLGLLLRRMKDEGYKAFYLEGTTTISAQSLEQGSACSARPRATLELESEHTLARDFLLARATTTKPIVHSA